MKFLIWFLCCLGFAVIQMILRDSGILLGGIPTVLLISLTFGIAKKLCGKWNLHVISRKAKAKGMTTFEYIQKKTDKNVIQKCEQLKCTKELKPYLEQQMEWGTITADQAKLLRQFYK